MPGLAIPDQLTNSVPVRLCLLTDLAFGSSRHSTAARSTNPDWSRPLLQREICLIDLAYLRAWAKTTAAEDQDFASDGLKPSLRDDILNKLLLDAAKSYERQACTSSGFLPSFLTQHAVCYAISVLLA